MLPQNVVEDINNVKNITCWWTRTPGAEVNTVTLVCSDGAVSGGIYLRSANNDSISIRPAMWITIEEKEGFSPMVKIWIFTNEHTNIHDGNKIWTVEIGF